MDKEKLLETLRKKGFHAEYFETAEDAVTDLKENITGQSVGIGGSMTVKEMGLAKALMENNKVFWHWLPEQNQAFGGAGAVREMANDADVYISSVNALAETGEMVNIDGTGNRISALAYGPKRVYFIVGINKVVENLQKAVWRAKNIAAPKNAQRLNVKTPCAAKGDKCYDCNSPDRICNGILISERPMNGVETTVIIVGKELGM